MVTCSEDVRLGIIGCGTMGRCIISALLESGTLHARQIQGSVQQEASKQQLEEAFPDCAFSTNNQAVAEWSTVVLLWYGSGFPDTAIQL